MDEETIAEICRAGFGIAYRMLGSVSEAEDVVQEAMLRLIRASESGEEISSPQAYLATVITRLAIDQLRSARARRETYVGDWLPEPLLADPDEDPAGQAEMSDSLSTAFLVLLESLTPEQRAAFLLHDVFDYPYREVAEIVGVREANARQLARRARDRVDEGRPRFEASHEQREELARRFIAAAEEGDLEGLQSLLAEDVVLHGDGGGKVPAIARPLFGRDRVSRALLAWVRVGQRIPGLSMRPVEVNGGAGVLTLDGDGKVIGVIALETAEGNIQALHSVVNPDKLRHVGPVADVRALLRGLPSRS